MTKEKTVYLEYLDEFKSYGIPKSEIESLAPGWRGCGYPLS